MNGCYQPSLCEDSEFQTENSDAKKTPLQIEQWRTIALWGRGM